MVQDTRYKEDESLWLIGLVFSVLIGVPVILWLINHTWLSYWGLFFSWKQLAIIDFPFLPWVGELRNDIIELAKHPEQVEFFELLMKMTQAGIVIGWLPIVISILSIRSTLRHRADHVRRNITADSLPEIMSTHCPAIIPILHYGPLLNEDIKGQESREHPVEFAKRHNLVRMSKLDVDKTRKVFLANLGRKIKSINDLNIYERALFAIFASRVFDTHENGHKAQKMLDTLNRSCAHGTWNGEKGYPDFSLIRNEMNFYMNNIEAQELIKYFQYPTTYLHMLHSRAMSRGKLVSSNFRWLKGIDRNLWYVLNATGRKSPCIESLVNIQTYRTEYLAWQNGKVLVEVPLEQCIEAFKASLIKEGLLPKPFLPTTQSSL